MDLNRFTGIGNLGKDPELKYLPSGKSVTEVSVAMNRQYVNSGTGQAVKETEWMKVEAWGRNGELLHQMCKKGSRIYFEGRIKTDVYDKDGQKHYFTKCVLSIFILLGGGTGTPVQSEETQSDSSEGDMLPPEDDIPF